jgi:hypothetical protein
VHQSAAYERRAVRRGPAAPPGQQGCPRKKGARLESPDEMAADTTRWRKATVKLYGRKVAVRYKDRVALWYNSTRNAPLRIVVVRDPKGRRRDEAFFSTDPGMHVETILETYAQHWSLEVAFRDAKQQLGFEGSQARTQKAVERTGPFAFAVYAITIAWFCRIRHRQYPALPIMPWYRHKRGPSFADMQTLVKQEILQQGFRDTPANLRLLQKTKGANKPKSPDNLEVRASAGAVGRIFRSASPFTRPGWLFDGFRSTVRARFVESGAHFHTEQTQR